MKWFDATQPVGSFRGPQKADSLEHRALVSFAVDAHGNVWKLTECRGVPYSKALESGSNVNWAGVSVSMPGQAYDTILEMTVVEAKAFCDALVDGGEWASIYDAMSAKIVAEISADVGVATSTLATAAAAAEAPTKSERD